MSTKLSYAEDSGIWLSNAGFACLMTYLLERAGRSAEKPEHKSDVAILKSMWEEGRLWSGICLDMEHDLPDLKHPAFWSNQLKGLAEDVLEGRSAAHEPAKTRIGLIYGSTGWAHFFDCRQRQEARLG